MVKFGHPSLLGEPPLPVCANRLAGFLFVSECGKIKLDSWTLSFAILSYPLCPWRQCETPGAFLFVCPQPSPAAGGLFLRPAEQREQKQQTFCKLLILQRNTRNRKTGKLLKSWQSGRNRFYSVPHSVPHSVPPKSECSCGFLRCGNRRNKIFYIKIKKRNKIHIGARARGVHTRIVNIGKICCFCSFCSPAAKNRRRYDKLQRRRGNRFCSRRGSGGGEGWGWRFTTPSAATGCRGA